MKRHFLRMIDYDRYANSLMVDLIVKYGEPGNSTQIMAHLLTTPQVWLKRCKGLPAPGGPIWPNWPANTFATMVEQNHADWTEYLNTLSDYDFERVISYKRTTGEVYENILSDIIAHVINHGTHHRAQIGQQLKLNPSAQLPPTDYVIYRREADQKI